MFFRIMVSPYRTRRIFPIKRGRSRGGPRCTQIEGGRTLVDQIRQRRQLGRTGQPVTNVMVSVDAQLLGGGDDGLEGIPGPRSCIGSWPETDVALAHAPTRAQLHRVIVERDLGMLKHQQQIAEAKMKLMRGFVAGHTMTFYSEPSPALSQLLTSLGAAFTVFSPLQSLDVDIDVREEVRA